MKNLRTITEQDFNSECLETDVAEFVERSAARAVLVDEAGRVYLLNVSKHGYHKLPGGGVDEGEEIEQALARELLEEVGCNAEIIAELGVIVEYRGYEDGGLKQTSYCYLARQVGDQVESGLEEDELDAGMFEVKAKNIDEAIQLMENDKPNNLEGKFIQKRDVTFLQAAKAIM